MAEVDPPDVDERSMDHLFRSEGPIALATELARRKAQAVAPRWADGWIIAGDQVGSVVVGGAERQLTKRRDVEGAVEQLLVLSGTEHELCSALVVHDAATGESVAGVDVVRVRMRELDESEVRRYVERFEPFDSAGSYRLEDAAAMAPMAPFVTSVVGEDDSGVLGLPLPLLRRLFDQLDRQLRDR